jgi:hypothetical protein
MMDDKDSLIMPWGKYKNQYIHTLPSSYLKWLAENCDWDDVICEAADEEWQYRERYNCHKE